MTFPSLAEFPVFRASALAPKVAGRAFPLVQLSYPFMNLQTWMVYVRAQADVRRGTGGVTAISDQRGYVHGVFSWNLLCHPTYRKALWISDVIMAHLPGRALPDAVLAEIEALAKSTGAGMILVQMGGNIGGLRRDALLTRGFKPVGDRFEMVLHVTS